MADKTNAIRAGLYLRVSTDKQTLDNQRPEVVQLAKARGFDIVELYEEKASAAKERAAFDRMMLAAHRGKLDVIVVWSIDRFGRSMVGNLNTVLELDRIGVNVVSAREPWLDTSGPVRQLLIAIFSWVAEQERRRISERVRAGLERAKREGKKVGRPRKEIDLDLALHHRANGVSIRESARRLKCGASTLHRLLHAHDLVSQNPVAESVPKTPHSAEAA